jgi:hypothetical protein
MIVSIDQLANTLWLHDDQQTAVSKQAPSNILKDLSSNGKEHEWS